MTAARQQRKSPSGLGPALGLALGIAVFGGIFAPHATSATLSDRVDTADGEPAMSVDNDPVAQSGGTGVRRKNTSKNGNAERQPKSWSEAGGRLPLLPCCSHSSQRSLSDSGQTPAPPHYGHRREQPVKRDLNLATQWSIRCALYCALRPSPCVLSPLAPA